MTTPGPARPLRELDDGELWRALGGKPSVNRDVAAEICARTSASIKKGVMRVLDSRSHDADDAIQNAMIILVRAMAGDRRAFEPRNSGSLSAWAYAIGRSAALDLARKRRRIVSREVSATHKHGDRSPGDRDEFVNREQRRELPPWAAAARSEIAARMRAAASSADARVARGLEFLFLGHSFESAARSASVPAKTFTRHARAALLSVWLRQSRSEDG